MTTLIFDNLVKELSVNYSIQDFDVIDLLVKSASNVFNTDLSIIREDEKIYFMKLSNNKKINLNKNTIDKISKIFEKDLKNTNRTIQIEKAKKYLKSKDVINFEILKKSDNHFICVFNSITAILPFENIPGVDFEQYILGSKHFAVVHSYSYINKEVVLNCKHNLVELKKINSIIFNSNITKVNRYYGVRIKIYSKENIEPVIVKNLQMIYPKEKIIFFKDKNGI